jgi:hypothetical protein
MYKAMWGYLLVYVNLFCMLVAMLINSSSSQDGVTTHGMCIYQELRVSFFPLVSKCQPQESKNALHP